MGLSSQLQRSPLALKRRGHPTSKRRLWHLKSKKRPTAKHRFGRPIFTDGERRYGNLLFEICHELVKNGKPGRPTKTFKKGVHVRLKNKGSQAHKKGRKRPKYQSPWREHPATARTIAETDIHANHAEAFFSALRRKCATFRRKANMYAKSTKGLQRLLRVYWVVHNFLRVHFTTREVPAVALGLLERRLSVQEIFQIQMV